MSLFASRMPAIVLVVAAVLVSGCASGSVDSVEGASGDTYERIAPPDSQGGFVIDVETTESTEASQAPPGIVPLLHGRTQVIGTLDYREIGDGAYCIVDCYPWESLDDAEILAVVTTADEHGLRSLYEVYVSADGILAGDTPQSFAVDAIVGVGMDAYLPDAGGVSWELAAREKPRTVAIDEGLCVVGTLVYVESYREVETDSWAVVDALDPRTVSSGLTTQHVLAFLDAPVVLPWKTIAPDTASTP